MTYKGVLFYPLDPFKNEILIEDIAHSLSMQCRFNGHCSVFYSVAQHSVLVSEICDDKFKLSALLHDAAEAYLSDLPTPIKNRFTDYISYEDKLVAVINEKFGTNKEIPYEVKIADKIAFLTESRDLLSYIKVSSELSPLDDKIKPWTQRKSKSEFLKAFKRLYK
jgi:5'-deoxynucleotidase YfbR-like HD superfamily hydrolase